MTDQCIVRFRLAVPGGSNPDPMDDLRHQADALLNSLAPHCQWDLKWEIHPDEYMSGEVALWNAEVTARMTTRPTPPDPDPRPRPPRDPR